MEVAEPRCRLKAPRLDGGGSRPPRTPPRCCRATSTTDEALQATLTQQRWSWKAVHRRSCVPLPGSAGFGVDGAGRLDGLVKSRGDGGGSGGGFGGGALRNRT